MARWRDHAPKGSWRWVVRDGVSHVVREREDDCCTTLCGLFARGLALDVPVTPMCPDCRSRTDPGFLLPASEAERQPAREPAARARGHNLQNLKPRRIAT